MSESRLQGIDRDAVVFMMNRCERAPEGAQSETRNGKCPAPRDHLKMPQEMSFDSTEQLISKQQIVLLLACA
jgi:hypothetical protein